MLEILFYGKDLSINIFDVFILLGDIGFNFFRIGNFLFERFSVEV